jgi:hypothetical protein
MGESELLYLLFWLWEREWWLCGGSPSSKELLLLGEQELLVKYFIFALWCYVRQTFLSLYLLASSLLRFSYSTSKLEPSYSP